MRTKPNQQNTRTPNLNKSVAYKESQRIQALSLLKQIIKRIEHRELDVVNHGSWMGGTSNSLTVRIDLEESES